MTLFSSELIDATFIDAKERSESFLVMRKPRFFHVIFKGPFVLMRPAEVSADGITVNKNKERKMPISVFLANFSPYILEDVPVPDVFFKKTGESHALMMSSDFIVSPGDYMISEDSIYGSNGDYIVTKSSGINDIVSKSELIDKYIIISE